MAGGWYPGKEAFDTSRGLGIGSDYAASGGKGLDEGPGKAPSPLNIDKYPRRRSNPSPITQPGPAMGNLLGRIGDFLSKNSDMLIGMGAGMAGGRSIGEGIAGAGYGALYGGKQDIAEQTRQSTIAALMKQGYTREQAEAMAGQPKLLPTTSFTDIGGVNAPVTTSPFGVRLATGGIGAAPGSATAGAGRSVGQTAVLPDGRPVRWNGTTWQLWRD